MRRHVHDRETLRVLPDDVLALVPRVLDEQADAEPGPVLTAALAYHHAFAVEAIRHARIASIEPLTLGLPATRWQAHVPNAPVRLIEVDGTTPDYVARAARALLLQVSCRIGEFIRRTPRGPFSTVTVRGEVVDLFAHAVGYGITPAALVDSGLAALRPFDRYRAAIAAGYAPSMAIRIADAPSIPRTPVRKEAA